MKVASATRSGWKPILAASLFAALSPSRSQAQDAGPSPGPADGNNALQEITVTATRRAQNIQDVPIAITAISADSALQAGVTGTEQLQSLVPSLVMARNANSANPYLRGVGFSSADTNAENSVAIYVDGVYQPITQGNFFEFNDLDRIEVLKGPQGTLFGRNATGGVIQIITRDPSNAPELDISGGYANYNAVSGSLFATDGLTEHAAFDVALMYDRQFDGWGTDLFTGAPTFQSTDGSIRTKLLITPDDATKIIFALDYYHYSNEGLGGQPPFGLSGDPAHLVGATPVPAAAFPGNVAVGPFPAGGGFPGDFNTTADTPNNAHADNRGLSVKIDHDFGILQLRDITAFRKFDGVWAVDSDLSPVDAVAAYLTQHADTFSEEVHVLSPSEARLQWLGGVFYFRNQADFSPTSLQSAFAFAPFASFNQYAGTLAQSTSLFGQATYPIADAVNLTLGLRETHDTSYYYGTAVLEMPNDAASVVAVPLNHGYLSYSKPTWRVALDKKLTSDVLTYVSYNRGIKSGNFSDSNVTAAAALYQPEQLDAYETGLKAEFLDRRARINSALFYYKYKDAQFQKIVNDAGEILVADSEKSYGAESDAEFAVTGALTLSANVGYLHSEIGNFPYVATIRLPDGQSANTPPDTYNAEGNKAPFTPDFSGNIGFSYKVAMPQGNLTLSSTLFYTDKYFTEPDNRLYVQAHELLSASLAWTDDTGRMTVRGWGTNLTNVYYYDQLSGRDASSDLGSPAAPRQYGITFGLKMR